MLQPGNQNQTRTGRDPATWSAKDTVCPLDWRNTFRSGKLLTAGASVVVVDTVGGAAVVDDPIMVEDATVEAVEAVVEEVAAIELQSANVHMHAFGAAGRSSLLDAGGHKETLLHIPQWDLNWQRDFMFTGGKIIPRSKFADTRLIVECTYSNYTEETVYGGYGSDDEMCFNFSYVAIIRGERVPVADTTD